MKLLRKAVPLRNEEPTPKLVKLSARTRQVPVVWRNNLLGDKKESMKRRVELIMNRNKKGI